ncbi:MAG: 5'-methylthioadenosine/adenosylhomocysteine nucleosidase, partial [Oscillospiraceae bacterium]|nr:5'-methylthioadenosine/adenosylhomocysteine nucleosidase [Oscillospiraceae bacterium]
MKTVGIIGAMPAEVADIRESLGAAETVAHGGFEFYVNKTDSLTLVNVCCGVGKVNAAICTQMLIDRFSVSVII